jgi:BirA family transcriptional regulator, biotin operon repressor / biotin---[acetyl-CoA-carboxylase] ligase
MTRNADALKDFDVNVAERLTTAVLGRITRFEKIVTSTNDIAREWAASRNLRAPHGALIFAESQSKGRGRLGRKWVSQSGLNLTFSLVLRPDIPVARFPLLTLAAGKSIHVVMNRHWPALRSKIKWPNDILVNGLKCAGILLESSIGLATDENVVVLGIGMNVNQAEFSADIEERATSILLETGQLQDRVGILAEVLLELEVQLELISTAPAVFITSYESALEGLGEMVHMNTMSARDSSLQRGSKAGPDASGRILGITPDGALRLQTKSGVHVFHAGEVTLLHDKSG